MNSAIQEYTQEQLNEMRQFVLQCAIDQEDFDYINDFATEREIFSYVNRYYNGGAIAFVRDIES